MISAFFLLSCGTNTPRIPPELLDTRGGCSAPDYPAAPYGTEEGDTLRNLCFRGWRNPATVAHDEASLETIAFSDYYDAHGAKGVRLILVNTAAVWCSACQEEHMTLGERFDGLSKKGLVVLGTLFQDRQRNPSTLRDLAVWADTFSTNFPFVLDPEYQMGPYASAETAPLNLVIDARNMKILRKIIGDQPTVIWPFIEQRLAQSTPPGPVADAQSDGP